MLKVDFLIIYFRFLCFHSINTTCLSTEPDWFPICWSVMTTRSWFCIIFCCSISLVFRKQGLGSIGLEILSFRQKFPYLFVIKRSSRYQTLEVTWALYSWFLMVFSLFTFEISAISYSPPFGSWITFHKCDHFRFIYLR